MLSVPHPLLLPNGATAIAVAPFFVQALARTDCLVVTFEQGAVL